VVRVLLALVLTAAATASPAGVAPQLSPPNASPAELASLTGAFASFDARDLAGRRWRAKDLAGRVVLLDFWATWCAPCLADVPWLRQARDKFPVDRFVLIGVSLDTTDRRTLTAWLNRQRVDWPQIWDDRGFEGPLARRMGVETLPRSVLFDARGRAMATNLRGERLVATLNQLIDGARQPRPRLTN
jgi:thiol-disulfide isomerase/thioredoxin